MTLHSSGGDPRRWRIVELFVVAQPHHQPAFACSHLRESVWIAEQNGKRRARTYDAESAVHFGIHDRRTAQPEILPDALKARWRAQHAQPHDGLLDASPMTIANRGRA